MSSLIFKPQAIKNSLTMPMILECRSWLWFHSLCFCNVVVKIANSKLGRLHIVPTITKKQIKVGLKRLIFKHSKHTKHLELDDEFGF